MRCASHAHVVQLQLPGPSIPAANRRRFSQMRVLWQQETVQTSVKKREIGRLRKVRWADVQGIARYEVRDSDNVGHGARERASGKSMKTEKSRVTCDV